jgi:hypothetical protein
MVDFGTKPKRFLSRPDWLYFGQRPRSCETALKTFAGFAKNFEFVMPVPDQVRDDGAGTQNLLKLLDSTKASLRARLPPVEDPDAFYGE